MLRVLMLLEEAGGGGSPFFFMVTGSPVTQKGIWEASPSGRVLPSSDYAMGTRAGESVFDSPVHLLC